VTDLAPGTDLTPLEARLWAVLDPYRDRLVPGSVYGLSTLTRPGASAHAFFAGVRLAERHVAFHLMPVYRDPALLDGVSPTLRRRLKGKSTFSFVTIDEPLILELEALVARSFESYLAGWGSR
jgi:hypothetical protein